MIEKRDPDYVLIAKKPNRVPVQPEEEAFDAIIGRSRPVKRAWNIRGEIKISEGPAFEE